MVTSTVPETARQSATLRDLTRRVQAEYTEMPGLSVTLSQAQRLLGIDRETCAVVIRTLVDRRFLRRTAQGRYVRF
jgi:predicted transcriptional regulator of viral defense system